MSGKGAIFNVTITRTEMKAYTLCLAGCIISVYLISCSSQEKSTEKLTGSLKAERPDSLLAQEAARPLLKMLVGNWVVIESSFSNDENSLGAMEVVDAADGSGIYSKLMIGSGDTYYEAVALWGYSGPGDQVRVFEVNNVGTADIHVGYFKSDSSLHLDFQDLKTGIAQQRVMLWNKDTLRISAQFIDKGNLTVHRMVFVKRNF